MWMCHRYTVMNQRVWLSQVHVAHVITAERLMVKASYVESCPLLASLELNSWPWVNSVLTGSTLKCDPLHFFLSVVFPAEYKHFYLYSSIDPLGFKSIPSLLCCMYLELRPAGTTNVHSVWALSVMNSLYLLLITGHRALVVSVFV